MEEVRQVVLQRFLFSDLSPEVTELVDVAQEQARQAYAPYSRFSVGAALRLSDGTIVRGSNQENRAYPSGLCAERVALFAAGSAFPMVAPKVMVLLSMHEGRLSDRPVFPCGGCLQVMVECEARWATPLGIYCVGRDEVLFFDGVRHLLPFAFQLPG